jgi:hypothetical protein
VEVKTSWVEVDTRLPDPESYIQMDASIPKYKMGTAGKDTIWQPDGRRPARLALVGLHVAGSVKGHPELIWATFEHVANTPNAAYQYYTSAATGPQTVCQNTNGRWLFCQSGATDGFNTPAQHLTDDKAIQTEIVSSIKPTNTIRYKPFGAAGNQRPNPNVPDVAASNTQIISMNNSVRSQLTGGDRRANYFMLGATWTDGTGAPGYSFGSTERANVVGASQLANSTMETFLHPDSAFNKDHSCFTCHKNKNGEGIGAATTSVSQVFGPLQGLWR